MKDASEIMRVKREGPTPFRTNGLVGCYRTQVMLDQQNLIMSVLSLERRHQICGTQRSQGLKFGGESAPEDVERLPCQLLQFRRNFGGITGRETWKNRGLLRVVYPFIKDLTLWARAKVRSEANETGLLSGGR